MTGEGGRRGKTEGETASAWQGLTSGALWESPGKSGSWGMPTWKPLEMKLEKGNWSISGGRVRLVWAVTSGGKASVILWTRVC